MIKPLNGKKLKKLAQDRLKAVESLYKSGDYDLAGYIVGYVLEFALKAVICKTLNMPVYPRPNKKSQTDGFFITHSLERLLRLSGLEYKFSSSKAPRGLYGSWSAFSDWESTDRYETGKYSKVKVKRMINALTSKKDGLINWIEKNQKW